MATPRAFSWGSIPNLVIRGENRLITVRVEREGAEFFEALGIEADASGLNAEFVRTARGAFLRRLAWCFLWVDQNIHRFPGRDRIALVRAAMADPGVRGGQEPTVALAKFGAEVARRASRLGTLLEAWAAFSKAQVAAGRMGAQHARRARGALLLILSRAGLSQAAEAPLENLNGGTLAAFERAVFAQMRGAGPLALNRARNSIASTVRQARAVLSAEALRSPEYAALSLPPCVEEFRTRRIEGGEIVPEALPAARIMDRIRRGRVLMRRLAPRHWAALLLAQELGLRRREVATARWDWGREVELANGRQAVEFAVVLGEEFGPKGRGRRIVLDVEQEAVWRELVEARRDAAPEILGAGGEADRLRVVDRLGRWLSALGFAGPRGRHAKPVHKLRKLRSSKSLAGGQVDKAQAEMGHGDARTTLTHYNLAPRALG